MGSSATSYQATDTSGFVTLATNQTITGEKTFSANQTISQANTLSIGQGVYLGDTTGPPMALPGLEYGWTGFPTQKFDILISSVFGTNDVFLYCQGDATSNLVIEPGGGQDLYFSTGSSGDIVYISPNRTPVFNVSASGTLIATAGTGGTRIAKLRTEKSTMAAGTTGVIADTPVASTSIILVTPEFAPLGTLYYTISAGVGFTILSTNPADAGSVSWQRVTI